MRVHGYTCPNGSMVLSGHYSAPLANRQPASSKPGIKMVYPNQRLELQRQRRHLFVARGFSPTNLHHNYTAAYHPNRNLLIASPQESLDLPLNHHQEELGTP